MSLAGCMGEHRWGLFHLKVSTSHVFCQSKNTFMQQRKLKKHKKVTISKPSQTVWKPSQTVWTTKDRKGKKKKKGNIIL